jgi:DNA-binding CsgD family transcriptional regulator
MRRVEAEDEVADFISEMDGRATENQIRELRMLCSGLRPFEIAEELGVQDDGVRKNIRKMRERYRQAKRAKQN